MVKTKKTAVINKKLCVGCGCCQAVCPLKAVTVQGGMFAVVNTDLCVGCGKCVKACPACVIKVEVQA
ncbi:MAG: 4Fe-4S binding protein [Oscillospiraceae bacterium]|nr:4Fe-4S binding protein [Oscillospiraceae bacterium]